MCDDCCYGTQPSLQYTQADEMYSTRVATGLFFVDNRSMELTKLFCYYLWI